MSVGVSFADGFEQGQVVPVKVLCSEDAAMALAESDAQSLAAGEAVWQHVSGLGHCRSYPGYFPVEVHSVALEYKDHNGDQTQVLMVHEPGKPQGPFAYILMLKSVADQIPRKQGFRI